MFNIRKKVRLCSMYRDHKNNTSIPNKKTTLGSVNPKTILGNECVVCACGYKTLHDKTEGHQVKHVVMYFAMQCFPMQAST